MSEGNLSIHGMVNGWQSLAATRQNLSLGAHLHDTNLNLELLSGTAKLNKSLERMLGRAERFGTSIALYCLQRP